MGKAPTQAKAGNAIGARLRLVEGVKAPIAYFTLALLVIEAILGAVLGVGRLSERANEVIAYGMVASLLIVLLGFLAALFIRPNVLFQQGLIEDPIAAFRKVGQDLTGNDLKILGGMLGKGARFFSDFCQGVTEDDDAKQRERRSKLEKMKLIQPVGSSEVELSMIGTTFIQTVKRFSEAFVLPEASTESIERIALPRIFFATTKKYLNLGAEADLAALTAFSKSDFCIEKNLSSDVLRLELIRQKFDIVHLLMDLDQADGTLIFENGDRMRADGFVQLVRQTGAKLVVLATCDSIALGAKLAPHTNVVAATTSFMAPTFAPWATSFYHMISNKNSLSRAFEIARVTTDAPMILLMKRDTMFAS